MLYAIIAFALFLVPSIFGHPLASGDNLIQFNPLRVLSGKIASQGNLPLWNKFAWSGSPLLAGFNAGFYLPTSWLYAILPSQIAWGLTQAIPYFVAALGFYNLAREYSISKFTSVISGLIFAYSGVMIAQGVHLDMITGISLAPWMLLCTKRIIEGSKTTRLRYSLCLAVLYALIVLAGAPEAMLDELIMLLVFTLINLYKFRSDWLVKILWLALAGGLALAISAAQWVPGLAYQKISQRAAPTLAFVSFGSFAPSYFFSLFSPYLFGGPGAFNIPYYFGPFNWEEVIIYPTLGPIIALFSTIWRMIKRTLDSEIVPFVAMAAVSVLLAFGSYTPLERLLYYVPLYGKQRLAGRNILVFNLCIVMFFAFWLDKAMNSNRSKKLRRALLTFSPAVISALLFSLFIWKPNTVATFFQASQPSPYFNLPIKFEIFAIQIVAMIISGIAYYRLNRRSGYRAKVFLVVALVIELLTFNMFGMLGAPSYESVFDSSTSQMSYLHSLIGNSYRFALYDPNLFDYNQVVKLGEPNLNIDANNSSIQGYDSLALNNYQKATGSHAQATFQPSLLNSPLIDSLGTRVILTNWRYLITKFGSPELAPIPTQISNGSATSRGAAAHGFSQHTTNTYGFFGRILDTSGIDINLPTDISSSTIKRVGLLQSDGSVTWLTKSISQHAPKSAVHYSIAQTAPIPAVAAVVRENLPNGVSDSNHSLLVGVGANSTQGYFALSGSLGSYLTYPHYLFSGVVSRMSVFINSQAKPSLVSSSADIKILSHNTALDGALTINVEATKSGYINWAETYAPGWKIRYRKIGSQAHKTIAEVNNGVTQKIPIPKGNWQISLYYHPSSVYSGLEISLLALVVLGSLVIVEIKRSRNRTVGDQLGNSIIEPGEKVS